ncbi:MAG TPA: AAA family ATPase [Telluria sp.]|nr:AAA family ATPase [Telluria sp.]
MTHPPFLTRVVLHNYKSIVSCDVRLGALSYLVGPNGAGKSNFLDALEFVAEALRTSLDSAISARWGISNMLHRSLGSATYVGIRLEFSFSNGWDGEYAFTLQPSATGGFEVDSEKCSIFTAVERHFFITSKGMLHTTSEPSFPPVATDRLTLVNAAGFPVFRRVFDALSSMGIYSFDVAKMRALQKPQDGRFLKPDGENLASVLNYMQRAEPDAFELTQRYLNLTVPSVHGVAHYAIEPMETVVFKQNLDSRAIENRFYANSMSEGTLRALGVLVALFQRGAPDAPRVVGIEEPETALHPAGFAAMREAISRSAERAQVIVTSHSPDLLDDIELDPSSMLVVTIANGATQIAPLGDASRDAIKTDLFSAGELLRLNQLEPNRDVWTNVNSKLPDLWNYAQP